MLDRERVQAFVTEWIAAWNSRDLERILAHWADDCVFESPLAASLVGDGVVRGKEALRAYWAKGLAIATDLQFTLTGVSIGHASFVIHYRNHRGQDCAEMVRIDAAGKAVAGAAHYRT